MNTILKTQGLNKVYSLGSFPRTIKVQALDDINLDIESDQPVIVSLVGESGSGKTTLAKVILRLVQPSSGAVTVAGHTVAGKGTRPNHNEFLRTVQPIFQNPFEAFSQHRTVDSYLRETAERVGKLHKDAAIQAVEEALAAVGLQYSDVRGKYPNQFSGGELQRASVARALIPRPQLIVADEPVSMIDASRRMIIINLFMALKEEYRTSFLYITHDLATAYYISDYIAVMNKGRIVEFGDAKQVLSQPQHEYTQLLLDSIPRLNSRWVERRNPTTG
ncbi:MAG: ABC transporter ATP-binding protein [Caldilinea sp.]|nr:ABC transporter ATP-binding protein [Caldilinea sp.]MCB0146411.1 ABC transporter ATP-binding protein [Caldilineaceae bacterium]MCB0054945.1 ABC transporter ATP-binding protein [Caldilinea sp.]MCB9116117.1 ABC transporter ATP-binding protein [Caldilineaceae bacterium]MCB9118932.1 ABC transporter ATP-binding protein [Caldilineaceae bacterium]